MMQFLNRYSWQSLLSGTFAKLILGGLTICLVIGGLGIWLAFLSRCAISVTIFSLLLTPLSLLLYFTLVIQNEFIQPLQCLNQAVVNSIKTGSFKLPEILANRETKSLAINIQRGWEKLVSPQELQVEIERRLEIEAALREVEARENAQSLQLENTLLQLQKNQAQMIQNETISSLGQMVAGIAHEINNPVSFIYGNIEPAQAYFQDLVQLICLYQQSYPQPNREIQNFIAKIELDFLIQDLQSLIGSMEAGTNRISDIILSLRNFSRLDEAEMKDVDVHEGIESTILILQNRISSTGIKLDRNYGELPPVDCYPSQLNQVFYHLLNNAIDALQIPENSDLEILSDFNQAQPTISISTEVLCNNRISIRIRDNGIGMTSETKKRLFDPFFSNKVTGKGTGLGLSISYQIVVETHSGVLNFTSDLGKGTEFLIEIPIYQTHANSIIYEQIYASNS